MFKEMQATLRLALPVMGAQLLTMSMVVVDNLVVARLGPEPLAAMAMAVTLYGLVFVFSLGLLSAVGPLVSAHVGSGQADRVGRTVSRGLQLSVCLAVVMVVLFHWSDRIFLALGQKPELVPMARQFLMSVAWGAPAVTGFMALRQFTEGTSDMRPSMAVSAMAALLNPFLDVGLVLGWGGMPRLGIMGAGLAVATAQWVQFSLMLAYLRFNRRYDQYGFWRRQSPHGHTLAHVLKVGLPLAGSLLCEVSFFGASTLLMGILGTRELASHQIALNACSFAFMIPLGLSIALAIRIGQAVGQEDAAAVRRIGRSGALLATCGQCVTATIFLLAADRITALYTPEPDVVRLAATLLRIGGVFQLFDGLQVVGMGMLRGALDTRVPFLAAMVSYWVIGLPSAWLLAFPLHGGPTGLWEGMVLGLGTAALLHQWRFQVVTGRLLASAAPALAQNASHVLASAVGK